MVNFLELLWAASALCVAAALYGVLRKRGRMARRWGIAAAVGVVVCVVLELALPAG
jgi:hypothetical protein